MCHDDRDFKRLIDIIEWLKAHPNSGLYPRQLPISGMDSKWLETRKQIISDLISCTSDVKQNDFYQRCGLKAPPSLVRLKILDPQLRNYIGGLNDISIPWEEATQLYIPATAVLIVENLQKGLAFTDIPGMIVIMGLGYHIDKIFKLSMLAKSQIFYWGDIDTHGFAILNRLRKNLPQVKSLLMNEEILLKYRASWVRENKPHNAESLQFLTQDEQQLYQRLKENYWQSNLRLEQERIEWDEAMNAIKSTLIPPSALPLLPLTFFE